jgi:alkyl hydroperoxide reductase subunit AhpC
MALRINEAAPDFDAMSTEGPISFYRWIGDGYAVIFSHPRDFTPVCTTEFATAARLAGAFAARNTRILGVSVDSLEDHRRWIADIEAVAETPVGFPIIDDTSLAVAKAYRMLPAEHALPETGRTPADNATERTVYIIGPDRRIRLSLSYPMSVGRNFDEILRALDAIRATDGLPLATPANWRPGEPMIVAASLATPEAEARYGALKIRLPYLRYAPATVQG